MALLDLLAPKAKYSNADLSFGVASSFQPGPVYPIANLDLLPGQTVHLDTVARAITEPLKRINFDGYLLQVDYFACDWRNYVPNFSVDASSGFTTPEDLMQRLPSVSVARFDPTKAPGGAFTYKLMSKMGVRPNSLASWCGRAVGDVPLKCKTDPQTEVFDRHPILHQLSYYDIMRNFYVNPSEGYMFVRDTDGNFLPTKLSDWDALFRFARGSWDSASTAEPDWVGQYSKTQSYTLKHLKSWFMGAVMGDGAASLQQESDLTLNGLGLALRCYKPDFFNTWLSDGTFRKMEMASKVEVTDNAFTINKFRFQNKTQQLFDRALAAGGRFTDFLRAQYCVDIDDNDGRPVYLGSSMGNIGFQEIQATATTDGAYQGGALGDLGALGRCGLRSLRRNFRAKTYTTIVVCLSIVPRVRYFSGESPFERKVALNDLYFPAYDRAAYQPLLKNSVCVYPDMTYNASKMEYSVVQPSKDSRKLVLARHPGWIEYVTRVSTVNGSLHPRSVPGADGPGTMYDNMCNLRDYQEPYRKSNPNEEDFDRSFSFTTAINPTSSQRGFVRQSLDAENFYIDVNFDVKSRVPMSKHLMPALRS